MRTLANLTHGGIARAIGALAAAAVMVGCNRPKSTGDEETDDPGAGDDPPTDVVVDDKVAYLEPLTKAPWLGHADDGALVKLEFFAKDDPSSATCRANVKTMNGNAPTEISKFEAGEDLANVTWGKGKITSNATFNAESKTLEANVSSKVGMHQVRLRQVTVEDNPLLGSYLKSVPDDEITQGVHKEFAATLEKGASWWESGADWKALVTPQNIAPSPGYTALIRPAGNEILKIPELESGADFNIPLECHLPPGSALAEDQTTIGIVTELHQGNIVQSAWILNLLNPGATIQELNGLWVHHEGEPIPVGEATLYVYLAKTSAEGDANSTEIDKPLSNLLKLKIELGGEPKATEEAE